MSPRHLRDRDDVATIIADACFPGSAGADRVGLELELFPVRIDGTDVTRVPLHGPRGSWAALRDASDRGQWCGPAVDVGMPLPLRQGGFVTAEPGGQVEISAGVADDVDRALDDLDLLVAQLGTEFSAAGIDLLTAGTDQWADRSVVDQQLDRPRYRAMDAGLATRGPWGRVMMRHTASLQVNLDAGPSATARRRYALGLLLGPLTSATFAASPTEVLDPDGAWSAVGERTVAWQRLDPTRTGTPRAFVDGEDDPVAIMTDAALRADVLFVVDGDDAMAGAPGWTFADWLDGRGPRSVTAADLRVHLSTLFHDVRPRGPLEFRAVDALPAAWRAVPAVLLTAALYDDRTTDRLLDLLLPHRRTLPDLGLRAAHSGVRDPQLCALAVESWSYALEGAGRLGISLGRRRQCERFLDAFTLRGLTVADALAGEDVAARIGRCLEPRPSLDTVETT